MVTGEEADLRQALLSPSTPRTTSDDNDDDVESTPRNSNPPTSSFLPPPEEDYSIPSARLRASSSSSFNVTSFNWSNFWFGGSRRRRRRNTSNDDDDDDDDTSSASSCLVKYWNDTLSSNRGLLLSIVLLIVWPMGLRSYMRFSQKTDSTFRVVPGSPSAVAQDAFLSAYSSSSDSFMMDPMNPPLVLVLTANNNNNNETSNRATLTHNGTPAYAQAHNFSLNLSPYLNSSSLHAYSDAIWWRVTSFYDLVDNDLRWMADSSFAVPNGSSVLLQVEYTLPANEAKYHHKKRILKLMDAIDDYQNQFWKAQQQENRTQYFTVHYTGIEYFASDLALSTRHDLMRMDLIVLPLALLLMGIVLKSANPFAVWIIPIITVTTTVCTWSIIMRFVASYMQVSTFVPTVMMSLSLGLGIDYTMFLLARYLEEIRNVSRRRAIVRMLSGSGNVLVLSGITLAATFLGLVFLPLSMLQSIGIGAATAILSALAVNLTVVPALLHTPLGLWIVAADDPTSLHDSDHLRAHSVAPRLEHPITNDANDDPMQSEPPSIGRRSLSGRIAGTIDSPQSSMWFRLSRQLLHPYRGIIILLVALQFLLPVARHATRIKSSISFELLLPRESSSLRTFHALGEQMGLGNLNPYRILFDGHAVNITMTSELGFEVMHVVLDELRAIDSSDHDLVDSVNHVGIGTHDEMTELSAKIFDIVEHPVRDAHRRKHEECNNILSKRAKPTMYNGISVLKNTKIPHALFVSAKYCSQLKPHCPFELLHVIDEIDKHTTSQDQYATFLTATLGISPFSDEGVAWLEAARATIDRLESDGALSGVKVYIEGSAGIAHDAVNAVHRAFPTMIAITTIVVFLLQGVFFRSIFPPIRSIITISLTLAFSFGLAVLVFQDGFLNWTHLRALTSIGDEVCWLVPIMALSIVIGLALDYDIFLISRILEFRLQDYEHKTSVAAGLESTGRVITAAGLIMAFAFGSLMFGSNPVLYQWSFLLTTAVLLDTFVIRTICVPVLTGLAGKYCWWPRKLPEDRICFVEFQQQETDDVASLLRTLEASSEYEPLRTNDSSVIQ